MRLGLVSDSHDNLVAVKAAVAAFRERGVGFVLHAGDVTLPATLAAFAPLSGAVVAGNNDDLPRLASAAYAQGWACGPTWEGRLAGRRLALAHGHDRGALRRLLRARPDLLVTGHTHRARDERVDGVRVVNPGALHRAATWQVAVLDLGSGALERIEVPKGR